MYWSSFALHRIEVLIVMVIIRTRSEEVDEQLIRNMIDVRLIKHLERGAVDLTQKSCR